MNSKFVDLKRTVSINWNKSNEQPKDNEILEIQRIHTNSAPYKHKQEHDDIGNFHDDALDVVDLQCT